MKLEEVMNKLRLCTEKRAKIEEQAKRIKRKIVQAKAEESAHAKIILSMCCNGDENDQKPPEPPFWNKLKIQCGTLTAFGKLCELTSDQQTAIKMFIDRQTDSISRTEYLQSVLNREPDDYNILGTFDRHKNRLRNSLKTSGMPLECSASSKKVLFCTKNRKNLA